MPKIETLVEKVLEYLLACKLEFSGECKSATICTIV